MPRKHAWLRRIRFVDGLRTSCFGVPVAVSVTTRCARGSVTPERLELADRAARMRSTGAPILVIADVLGISRSYASALLTDPDGSQARARKDRYRGACVECGAPTSGSNGRTLAPERCLPCTNAVRQRQKYWTYDRIVDAIRRFADEHGRPPRSPEWSHVDRERDYPSFTSVYANPHSPFAKWADAIEAAGFERPLVGMYERSTGEKGLSDKTTRPLLAWLRSHPGPHTSKELQDVLGRSQSDIWSAANRLVRRGLAVKTGGGGRYRQNYYEAT